MRSSDGSPSGGGLAVSLRFDLGERARFERRVNHLHRLGPRCLGEFLAALAEAEPDAASGIETHEAEA